MNYDFLVFLEEGHDCISACELMFHFSLFLRNFHPISASWMSHFRKVRCLSLAVSIFHFVMWQFPALAKGVEKCNCFSQYHDKRSFKRKV